MLGDEYVKLTIKTEISVPELLSALRTLTAHSRAYTEVSVADAKGIIACGKTLLDLAERELANRRADDHQR